MNVPTPIIAVTILTIVALAFVINFLVKKSRGLRIEFQNNLGQPMDLEHAETQLQTKKFLLERFVPHEKNPRKFTYYVTGVGLIYAKGYPHCPVFVRMVFDSRHRPDESGATEYQVAKNEAGYSYLSPIEVAVLT